jgi:hypothetical protein
MSSGEFALVVVRRERGLDESAVRKTSKREVRPKVLLLLRKRTGRLVEKVLDEEPLRGSDRQTWERNHTRMQTLCDSRGWTAST